MTGGCFQSLPPQKIEQEYEFLRLPVPLALALLRPPALILALALALDLAPLRLSSLTPRGGCRQSTVDRCWTRIMPLDRLPMLGTNLLYLPSTYYKY